MAVIKCADTRSREGDEDSCNHCGHHMVWGEAGIVWEVRGGVRLVLCPPCIPKFLGGLCRDYQSLLQSGTHTYWVRYPEGESYDHKGYLSDFANHFVAFESKAAMERERIQKLMAEEVTHK